MSAVVLLGLAIALHFLGTWGRRNAAGLVPVLLPAHQAQRRKGALRRGAWACHAASVMLVVGAALPLL